MDNLDKAKKLVGFARDKELAQFKELQGIGESLDNLNKSIKDLPEFPPVPEKMKVEIEGAELVTIKGESGKTPQKGTDYFTPEEVNEIKTEVIKSATPKKGVDYFDGKDGRSIMHYGKIAPSNPQKGDLWYQD